jgi:hypothetical protein
MVNASVGIFEVAKPLRSASTRSDHLDVEMSSACGPIGRSGASSDEPLVSSATADAGVHDERAPGLLLSEPDTGSDAA